MVSGIDKYQCWKLFSKKNKNISPKVLWVRNFVVPLHPLSR